MTADGVKNAHLMSDTIYDEVRYSNFPYAQTHPDRLATVAMLHGIEPPDPFSARVLEIGCGAGGNLLAMAAATPGIRAVGVDLAATPIAEAQQAVAEIGLDERRVPPGRRPRPDERSSSVSSTTSIAHGVYGWIPVEADDALLATIKASLAPDGIAYVSFNAQPGGYFRRMLRDVGLWHARNEDGARSRRRRKAQELYKFLQEHRVTPADTYGALLEREVPVLADAPELPARARRPRRALDAALVRGVRRARRGPRARLRGRGRPLQPALGDAARRRRAARVEPRRR